MLKKKNCSVYIYNENEHITEEIKTNYSFEIYLTCFDRQQRIIKKQLRHWIEQNARRNIFAVLIQLLTIILVMSIFIGI